MPERLDRIGSPRAIPTPGTLGVYRASPEIHVWRPPAYVGHRIVERREDHIRVGAGVEELEGSHDPFRSRDLEEDMPYPFRGHSRQGRADAKEHHRRTESPTSVEMCIGASASKTFVGMPRRSRVERDVQPATRSRVAKIALASSLWLVFDKVMGRVRDACAEGRPSMLWPNALGTWTTKLRLESKGGGAPQSTP